MVLKKKKSVEPVISLDPHYHCYKGLHHLKWHRISKMEAGNYYLNQKWIQFIGLFIGLMERISSSCHL